MLKNSNIIEIENEYKRINGKWLNLHYKTAKYLMIFAVIMECIFGCVLFQMGEIHISLSRYLVKYTILPFAFNLLLILFGYFGIRNTAISQKTKEYIISFVLIGICFILFSVHVIFVAIYLVFTIPILFTVVYSDYLLTTIIAVTSIVARIISEILITWDPDKIDVFKENINFSNFIISIILLFVFYVVSLIVILLEKEKNEASIQKELERQQLQQKVHSDDLTDINNRAALRAAFQNMEEDTSGNRYIFVMIDIDNFKKLNDTLGHTKGDLFLVEFGNILKSNCASATPFRFGGDEFCILFKNHKLNEVVEICSHIKDKFQQYVHKNEIQFPLSVSFGIAKYSYEMTASQLLKNADVALYHSKTIKNTIRIFE